MNKIATYYKRLHQLEYWDSRNTTITIDCRSLTCAKMTLSANFHCRKVYQTLVVKN